MRGGMRRWLFLFCCLFVLGSYAKVPLRVACVGNSVTYGYGLAERETQAYPVVLQQLLGSGFDVRNFGHSGSTLLSKGHRPYIEQQAYADALAFRPDWVIIHLGLNDTDPRNWPNYGDDFIQDYCRLIDAFRSANPKAKVWICRMTPIGHRHSRFRSGTRDWHAQIQEAIGRVAHAAEVECIDLHAPLYTRPELFPDALHPNAEGARIIAETVYCRLTGNFGGLQLPAYYGNGMVLQRGDSLRFHGKANRGEKVRIAFGGKTSDVVAGADGEWSDVRKCLPAGGPYKLTVSTKKQKVVIDSLFVGDVWFCSGQSNMELPVSQTATAQEDITNASKARDLHIFNMRTRYPTDNVEWERTVLDSVNHLRLFAPVRWQKADGRAVANFSSIAYHLGRVLADSLQIPVGIICNAVGGTTTESWIDRKTLEWEFPQILYNWYHGDFGMKWARERALKNIAQTTDKLQRHPYEPCYMFESGMLPFTGMNVKGVVWYQGESNAHNIELHERLFPLLENSWRTFFAAERLPFYVVQLSSLNRPSWPSFRNSQRLLAEKCPFTYLTVTTDVGDSLDVHYKNKRPIGERLARQILRHSYSCDLLSDSPELRSVSSEGNMLRLSFDHSAGLTAADGRLKAFEVAGIDGLYHPAEARIEGETVIVFSEKVKKPHFVRYGWKPFSDGNLVNGAGLPASTFKAEVGE